MDTPTIWSRAAAVAVAAWALAAPSAAQPARLDVRPSAIDFGAVDIGAVAHADLRIQNVGGSALTIHRLSLPSAEFTVDAATPVTRPPGSTWTVAVRFAPGVPGPRSAVLVVDSNDPLRPAVEVPLRGVGRTPVPAVVITPSPGHVRLAPGSRTTVAYEIRETAGVPVRVRSTGSYLEEGNGRRLDLSLPGLSVSVPAGATLRVDAAVVLPTAWRRWSASPQSLRLVRVFALDPGGVVESVPIDIDPVGSIAEDFRVRGVSVDMPVAGTVVPVGSSLMPRARIFGDGSSQVVARWLIDGVVVDQAGIDLQAGRALVVSPALPLPAGRPGRHELRFEIVDPEPGLGGSVRYTVSPRASTGMRLIGEPGFRMYLASGPAPEWTWTPVPGAARYELLIDGRPVADTTATRWTLPSSAGATPGAGLHRFTVRALAVGAPGDPAEAPAELGRAEQPFELLDTPAEIDVTQADGVLSWSGPSGAGVFVVTLLDGRSGSTIVRMMTASRTVAATDLLALAGPEADGAVRVDALNDHGDVVGRSAARRLREPRP